MRFASRAPLWDLLPLLALVTGLVSFAAVPRAETNLLPTVKSAPKSTLNWGQLSKPKNVTLKQLRARLNTADEFATLFALQVALTRVGDGQTYIWGRPSRKLRAFITPVNSFRNDSGRICRQIVVSLSLGSYLKRTEATACRADDRSWQIVG